LGRWVIEKSRTRGVGRDYLIRYRLICLSDIEDTIATHELDSYRQRLILSNPTLGPRVVPIETTTTNSDSSIVNDDDTKSMMADIAMVKGHGNVLAANHDHCRMLLLPPPTPCDTCCNNSAAATTTTPVTLQIPIWLRLLRYTYKSTWTSPHRDSNGRLLDEDDSEPIDEEEERRHWYNGPTNHHMGYSSVRWDKDQPATLVTQWVNTFKPSSSFVSSSTPIPLTTVTATTAIPPLPTPTTTTTSHGEERRLRRQQRRSGAFASSSTTATRESPPMIRRWQLPSRDVDSSIWMHILQSSTPLLLPPLIGIIFDYFDG
jgi:hypothetical protein